MKIYMNHLIFMIPSSSQAKQLTILTTTDSPLVTSSDYDLHDLVWLLSFFFEMPKAGISS